MLMWKHLLAFMAHIWNMASLEGNTLYPEIPNSVQPFRTNEGAVGNYTFSFRMSSSIKENPRFTIEFPIIYDQVLEDMGNCIAEVYIVQQNNRIEKGCSISDNIIEVGLYPEIDNLDAGYIEVTIMNVLNPENTLTHSSGNFYLNSWNGVALLVDTNKAFDSVAFAPAYSIFTSVNVVNDGATVAGYISNYIVSFTSTKDYQQDTWFRFHIPVDFEVTSHLSCVINDLDIGLSCISINNVIFVTGLSIDLPKNTEHKLKFIGIRNPYTASPQTDDFKFESLEHGVNTVIDFTDNIPGLAILPGEISDVTIIGFPLVQDLFVDYSITFLPTNSIPQDGAITIDFPPTFQGLDSTCRIIKGLTGIDGNPVACTVNANQIVISDFSVFIPQYITIKIFAQNPSTGGETAQWQLVTYTDTTFTQIIDQNPNAGSVVISSIGKPNFVGFDFYKRLFNCTFSEICTIDFRLYPHLNNVLTSSDNLNYSQIDLQIPHWWWLSGDNGQPECLFGDDPSYRCWQREHLFSIQTPNTRDYGYCELPVSVRSAKVTPIPGRYPWRVLTFRNGGKWSADNAAPDINEYETPIEQDTFIMDIPYSSISILQAYSSSLNSGDNDNLLHVRCNILPFAIPYEGAVNFNFTHVESNLEDKAEWPVKLGFSVPDNTATEIPCKVYIGGQPAGKQNGNTDFAWNYHRNVRCHLITGSSALKTNTIIQVVGLSRTLHVGNYFEVFIPNIKFCTTVGRRCKFTVSYTASYDLEDPYILNMREADLGTVTAPVALPATIAGNVWRSNDDKCLMSNLNIEFDDIPSDIEIGDYIIFKRVTSHWYFVNSDTYSINTPSVNGVQMLGYPVLVDAEDLEYIVVPVTDTILAGTNRLFTILNVRNSPYAGNEAIIHSVVYSDNNKIASGEFPMSNPINQGGIQNFATHMSDVYGSRLDRFARGYRHPYRYEFTICNLVPEGGEVVLTLSQSPSVNYASFEANCTLWETVSYKMANESHPTCYWDEPSLSFKIRQFEQIDMLTTINLQFYGILDQNIQPLDVDIYTYNVTGDTTPVDYLLNQVSMGATIDYDLAPKQEFVSWQELRREFYINDRGSFKINFILGHDLEYNLAEDNYLEFVFDASITVNGILECRYGEFPDGHRYPSVQCDYVAGAEYNLIRMRLHPLLKMEENEQYVVIVDTRNREINEGLTFTQSGVYSLSVYSFVGGVRQRNGQARFEVFGRRLPHFYIYSSNKVMDDWTLMILHAEFFNAPQNIRASDKATNDFGLMVVFFETANDGFAEDLGTGLPELETFPCLVRGLNLIANTDNPTCTLLYGYNNAPAKIEISNYDATNVNNLFIYLPLIKNPPSVRVPKVWFEIQRHVLAGGTKNIDIEWEGHYRELNMTYTKHPKYTFAPLTIDSTSIISHATNVLETLGLITLPIISTPKELELNDMIAYKFPLYWPLNKNLRANDCIGQPIADCYVISDTDLDYHLLVVKFSGTVPDGGTWRARVLSPSAVVPTSPPAPENVITAYVFHHTRLIRIVRLLNFGGVLMDADPINNVELNCAEAMPRENQQADYLAKFQLPHLLRNDAQLKIESFEYNEVVPSCSNTANSLLQGDITCIVDNTHAHVEGFSELPADNFIEISIPFTNPAYDAANEVREWQITSYFKASSGFFYLRGDSGLFEHVSPRCDIVELAGGPADASLYWPDMVHKYNYIRTEEIGPVHFLLQFPISFTITDDHYVKVTIPDVFVLAEAQFVGIWDDKDFARKWTHDEIAANHEFTIWFQKTGSIDSSQKYKLTLTTLNAQNNNNGFVYPDTQDIYTANVKLYSPGDTLESESDIPIYVFKTDFVTFESKALVVNSGFKNMLFISFISDDAVAAGSELKVKVPVTSYDYMGLKEIFDDDGGNNLQTGTILNCYIKEPAVAFVPTCTFSKGSRLQQTPITITLSGITAQINANTLVNLVIDGLRNPDEGNDDKHVYMSLEYHNGAHLYTGIDYDFTIINAALIVNTGLDAPVFTSDQIGNTNIELTLDFSCSNDLDVYDAATGVGHADYLILEFPDGYRLNHLQNTAAKISAPGSDFENVVVGTTNNIIVYYPDRPIATSTTYTLTVRRFDQAYVKPLNAVFKLYCVKDRIVITENEYEKVESYVATALDPNLIEIESLDLVQAEVPQLKYQTWKITFEIPAALAEVPNTGVIDLTIPTSLTDVDLYCRNSDSSQLVHSVGNDIICEFDNINNRFTISNFNAIVSAQKVAIEFKAKSPVEGNVGSLVIHIYSESEREFMMLEAAKEFPLSSAKFGFNYFKAINFTGHDYVRFIRNNDHAAVRFSFKIPADWTSTSSFSIEFDPSITKPANTFLKCLFDNYEAATCTVSSNSPLIIDISAPSTPALVIGDTYTVNIRAYCGSSDDEGFHFSASGLKTFKFTYNTNEFVSVAEILPPAFTSIETRLLALNMSFENAVYFKIDIGEPFPSEGFIIVTLPIYDKSGTKVVWQEYTGLTNGTESSKLCSIVSPGTLTPVPGKAVTCSYNKDNEYMYFTIKHLDAIAAGATIEFSINQVMLYAGTNDTHVIDVIVETQDSSKVAIEKGIITEIGGIDVSTYSTIDKATNVLRGTKDELKATDVEYTFTSVEVPDGLTANDYIIFSFPNQFLFENPLSNCEAATPGSYYSYGRHIIYSGTLAADNHTFCIGDIVNPSTNYSGPINVHVVKSQSFKTIQQYTMPTFILPGIIYTLSSATNQANQLNSITLEVDTDIELAENDYVEFQIPLEFKLNDFLLTDGLIGKYSSFTYKISASLRSILIVLNNDYSKASDGLIRLKIDVINPNNGTYDFTVNIGTDYGENYLLSTQTTGLTITASSFGFTAKLNSHSSAASSSETLGFTTTSASTNVDGEVSIDMVDNLNTCSDSSGPITTVCQLSGDIINFSPTMDPSTLNFDLEFGATTGYSTIYLIIDGIASVGSRYFISSTAFSSFDIENLHTNIKTNDNIANVLTITAEPALTIQTSSALVVDIIGNRLVGLGTGLPEKSYIPCYLEYAGSPDYSVMCQMYTTTSNFTRIVVTRSLTLNAGTSFTLVFYNIYNSDDIANITIVISHYDDLLTQTLHQSSSSTYTTTNAAFSDSSEGIADSTAQAASNLTLTFATSLVNANYVYLLLPNGLCNKRLADMTALSANSNYISSHCLVEVTNETGTDITINGIELGISAASEPVRAVVFDTDDVLTRTILEAKSFTFNILPNTLNALSLTQEVSDDKSLQYVLEFDMNCFATANTYIEIRLPSMINHISIESFSGVDITRVTGSLELTTDHNRIIHIKEYSYITPGVVSLRINLNGVIDTADPNNDGYFRLVNSSDETVMCQNTSLFMPYDDSQSATFRFIRGAIPKNEQQLAGTYQRLLFMFNLQEPLLSTDFLYIYPDSLFTVAANLKLNCKYTDLATKNEFFSKECFYDSTLERFSIASPINSSVVASSYYQLDIYTYMDDKRGIELPGTAQEYTFTAEHTNSGGTVKEGYSFGLKFPVLSTRALCYRNFLKNPNYKNIHSIRFRPSDDYSSAAIINVYLSTLLLNNGALVSSLPPSADQTRFNRESIPCNGYISVPGSTKTPSNFINRCILNYGASTNLYEYIKIEVILDAGLVTTDYYQIDILNILNPASEELYADSWIEIEESNVIKEGMHDSNILYITDSVPLTQAVNTLGTLTHEIQDAFSVTLDVNPTDSAQVDKDYDGILIIYPSIFHDNIISVTPTDLLVSLMDEDLIYLHAADDIATAFNLSIDSLKAGDHKISGLNDNINLFIIQKGLITNQIQYDFTFNANEVQFDNIIASSANFVANVKSTVDISFETTKIIPVNGSIVISLVNIDEFAAGCEETSGSYLGSFIHKYPDDTTLHIISANEIEVGVTISLKINVISSVNASQELCVMSYYEETLVNPINDNTCGNLTLGAIPGLLFTESMTYGRPNKIQGEERGPLTLEFVAPYAITQNTGMLEIITGPNFVNDVTKDFYCILNDFIASSCYYSTADSKWFVFAPRDNTIPVSTKVILQIYPIRQTLFASNPQFILFPIPSVVDLYIDFYDANTLLGTSTELYYNVPQYRWATNELNTFLIQRDTYSIYKLYFSNSRELNVSTQGRIVIEFPTADAFGTVYANELGTSNFHGEEYPCLSGPASTITFNCYIFFGNGILPANIIIYPGEAMLELSVIEVFIPPILNPLLEMTEIKLSVLGQEFDTVSLLWDTVMEYSDFIFIAVDLTVPEDNLPSPTWNPQNRVGQASDVTFSFTAEAEVKSQADGGFDRVIMQVDKEQLRFLNDMDVAGRVLTCPGWLINIYVDVNLIEFSPTATRAEGSAIDLDCTNFFNQQYVIPSGVSYYIEIWSNGYIAKRFTYGANLVDPNVLDASELTYKNTDLETGAFDTYTFKLLPTNDVPSSGYIDIQCSDDFQDLSNCEVYGGITGICVVETDGGYHHIKIFPKIDYSVAQDGDIFFHIDMNNPITPGTYSFTYTSYYNTDEIQAATDYAKIDEDTIDSFTYAGSTPFDLFSMEPVYSWVRDCCPNNWMFGVLKFKVAFSETLTYEDEHWLFIRDTQVRRGNHRSNFEELLCYFDKDETQFSVKSEDCVRAGDDYEMLIPEEFDLDPANDLTINIEIRGTNRGLVSGTMPRKYYFIVETNHPSLANEVAIIEFPMRGCYFDNIAVNIVHWHADLTTTLELKMDSNIAMNWRAGQGSDKIRIQLLFSTWNEIKETQYLDLGHDTLSAWNDTLSLPCFMHNDYNGNVINNVYQSKNINCEFYRGKEHSLEWPISATINDFTDGNVDQIRTGIGYFHNYMITDMNAYGYGTQNDGNRNTYTHVGVRVQNKLRDGNYTNINEVTQYHAMEHIKPWVDISAMVNGAVAKLVDLTFGTWHATYNMDINLPNNQFVNYIYYDLDPPHDMHYRNRTHNQRACSHVCNFYPHSFRRYVFEIGQTNNNFAVSHFGYAASPSFENTVASKTYVVENNALVYVIPDTVTTHGTEPQIILENEHADNPKNEKLRYRIAFYNNIPYTSEFKYVRIYIPLVFTDLSDCKAKFGFRPVDTTDPSRNVKCRITTNVDYLGINYHLLEFYDMEHWSANYNENLYENQFIFELWMRNPSVAQWTPEIHTEWYNNYDVGTDTYNSTMINMYTNSGSNKGRFWVGEEVPVANYFRVYRNRESFEERRQKTNEWAELHMRLYPKNVIPADDGIVEIHLSQDFDIPDGGSKICQVGHDYHQDLQGQFCEITNERIIRVKTNKNKGLDSICTLVKITTTNSVNDNNGFQAPAEFSTNEFELYLWDDTLLLEFTSAPAAIDSEALIEGEDLFIATTCNEIDELAFLKVKFNTTIRLHAGYDNDDKQADLFQKKPITSILLHFNTYDLFNVDRDGFPLDLGHPSGIVECEAINNIQPKAGERLKCEIEIAAERNFYHPVKLTISNFEKIERDTKDIEIHVIDVKWTGNVDNSGWIDFNVIQTSGDGKINVIYDKTRINLYSSDDTGIDYAIAPDLAYYPTIDNNTVGAKISTEFSISITNFLFEGDLIEVTYPTEFKFPNADEVSAVIKVVNANGTRFATAVTYVYSIVNKIHYILPKQFNIVGCTGGNPCVVTVITTGLRNAAYSFAAPYVLYVKVLSQKITFDKLIFNNLTPPAPAAFNSMLCTISSQFSEDINVTYTFDFVPSYNYYSGSLIRLTMNNGLFNHIDKSSPAVICKTNFDDLVDSCQVLEAMVEITLLGTLDENTNCKITLTGVKNPVFVGTTAHDDLLLQSYHSTGNLINEGYFNTLTYREKRNVGTLFFNIQANSLFQTVTSDYTITLQNTNALPAKGVISILMPSEWAENLPTPFKIFQLTGKFTNQQLVYEEDFITQPSNDVILRITPSFIWPAKSLLTIRLRSIPNPSNILLTPPFVASTYYDDILIDESDTDDVAARISYIPYEPKITLLASDFWPTNEAELATYFLSISSEDKLDSGTIININFPENYEQLVSEPLKSVSVTSTTVKIKTYAASSSVLRITLDEDITAEKVVDLLIKGIMNPNSNTLEHISMSTEFNGKLIQFTDNLVAFQTTVAAQHVKLSHISTTSNKLLVKSDYEFCITVYDEIPKNSAILIDFPKQFKFHSKVYSCKLGTGHNSNNLPYNTGQNGDIPCEIYHNLRRFNITGISDGFSGGGDPNDGQNYDLCYRIEEVENAFEPGESFNFVVRVYDIENKIMLYRTFGILKYPSSLDYVQSGFQVFVEEIPDIVIYTISNEISVTLEKAMPYVIKLEPYCEGFSFDPSELVFNPGEPITVKFTIIPNDSVEVGQYSITWTKTEETTTGDRFAEVFDSEFRVVDELLDNFMQIEVDQFVVKTAANSTSLPITLTLSQPSSKNIRVYYNTSNPSQPENLAFDPEYIEFLPGETSKSFTYFATAEAGSGLLYFNLAPEFSTLYTLETDYINLEITPADTTPPNIISIRDYNRNYNSNNFKINVDENSVIHYMLTKHNTLLPPVDELLNPELRNETASSLELKEQFGNAAVNITKATSSYSYHDVYFNIDGLDELTRYTLYAVPVDLSGNVGGIKSFNFTTSERENDAIFNLKGTTPVDLEKLLAALSLITGQPKEAFSFYKTPDLSQFNDLSEETINNLGPQEYIYQIKINGLHINGDISPFNLAIEVFNNKELLFEEVSELDPEYNFALTAKEIYKYEQIFTYDPFLVDLSTFHASFNVSTVYTANVYGVIVRETELKPSARQIKHGLDSKNQRLDDTFIAKNEIIVDDTEEYKVWPSIILTFTFLYHSTRYIAYFITENISSDKPILMDDNKIKEVKLLTDTEIFVIDDNYEYYEDIG